MNERLYRSLPTLYRQRDQEQGEPLRALLAVLEGELDALETNVDDLYEDAFIETCHDWVVPYLADLLGVRVLGDEPLAGAHPRTQVANALSYRQAKGTSLVLERTIHDVTGWFARVVEYFRHLAHTQNVELLRPGQGGTFDLRRSAEIRPPDDPFAPPVTFHTADVRRIAAERGRYNVPNLGIFLWRLGAFGVSASPAAPGTAAEEYFFDPLGRDLALFNRPLAPEESTRHADEHELPVAIRRDAMAGAEGLYYGPELAMEIFEDGVAVLAASVVANDLSAWTPSPALTSGQVAVDPELGRILFETAPAGAVTVSYHYGFSADMGGGPYDRRATLTEAAPGESLVLFTVSAAGPYTTLQDAADAWSAQGRPDAVIRVTDSGLYGDDLTLNLPADGRLALEAADGTRPVLRPASFRVVGEGADGELVVNGFLIDATLTLEQGFHLQLLHTTLVPRGGRPSLEHAAGDPGELSVSLSSSIAGALRLPTDLASLVVEDSILDAASGFGASLPAVVSDLLADPLDVQMGPRLLATLGAATATVTLDDVPTGHAAAAALLQSALQPLDSGVAVVSLGQRLLVRPGTSGAVVQFAAASDDTRTVQDLRLTAPPAESVEGLFSGPHDPFIPFAQPLLRATLGGLGPRSLALARTPRDLAEAAILLQQSLRAAGAEPTYTGAQVVTLDGYLLVRPGVAGDGVVFAEAGSTFAATLGLLAPPALRADGVFSGMTPPLGFTGPQLLATVGAAGPETLELTLLPADVTEARQALEGALDARSVSNGGTLPDGTEVLVVGSRLLVRPADGDDAVTFAAAGGDSAAETLRLLSPPAEPIRGWLFTPPAGPALTAPQVGVDLGGETATLTFTAVPTDLATAAFQLQQALNGASTSARYRLATVLAVGSGLFIQPGEAVAVSFSTTAADPVGAGELGTAAQLGLTRAFPLDGLLSGPITPFPAFPDPELEVTFGSLERTVVLTALPVSPATARDALQEALRRTDPADAFARASVALLDDRLVVISGEPGGEDVQVQPTAGDPTSAPELALERPPARLVDGFLSGLLEPFPPLGSLEVEVTLGTVTRTAVFTGFPADLDEARSDLEAAIHAADASPTFRGATVQRLGDWLLLQPGVGGDPVAVDVTANDPDTAQDLELTAALSRSIQGLLSGAVNPFPTFAAPTLAFDIGGGGAADVSLASLPTDVDEAETALRTAVEAAFAGATVLRFGDRLLVQPGDRTQGITATAGSGDPDTVQDLMLDAGSSGRDGRLSGDLSTFPSFPAGTPEVDVTMGGVTNRATLAATPTTLAEARTELEAAIQAAAPAVPDFANAVVEIVDGSRLLVRAGTAGTAVDLVDTGTPPNVATLLRLTTALSNDGVLSGDLAAFSGLTFGVRLEVTLGGTARTAALTAIPTDLAEAQSLLEAAIRAADPGATFVGATVEVLGDVLLVQPGAAGDSVAFADLGAPNAGPATASLLELTPGQAVDGLLSGEVNPFPTFTAPTLQVEVTVGGDGPYTLDLGSPLPPGNLEALRLSLETALQAAQPDNLSFTDAQVAVAGERLLLLPGVDGQTIVFSPAAASPDAVLTLELDNLEATRGLLSGPLPAQIVLTRAPRIDVTLGTDGPFRAIFDRLPTNVDEAAGALQAAIRSVAPAGNTAFEEAVVAASGSRLLVTPGAAVSPVLFADPESGFATATSLALTGAVSTASGVLSALRLPDPAPLRITVGASTALLDLAPVPLTLSQARDRLEAELTAQSVPARALFADGRLLVLPDDPADAVTFAPTGGDPADAGLTAEQLGLAAPPAVALGGYLSGLLSDPLTLTGEGVLEVTLGDRGPITVRLGTLASAAPETVRARFEESLRRADSSTAFTDAQVLALSETGGTRLLVLAGSPEDAVTIQAAGENVETYFELALDSGSGAAASGGLASGEPPFPALDLLPSFDLDIGGTSRRVSFSSLPDTFAGYRSVIESAIRRAGEEAPESSAFLDAEVRDLDGENLLIVAGAPGGAFIFTEAPGGAPTAAELGLLAGERGDGLLSGDLAGFTGLGQGPEIEVTFGLDGPRRVRLKLLPADLTEAATALQAAIRAAAASATFRGATVRSGLGPDRLLITPGVATDGVAFGVTADDPDTLGRLGLTAAELFPAGGLLSGLPAAGAFSALALTVTLAGGPDETVELARSPQTLAEAAQLLEQALRAVAGGPSYTAARVRVIDERLLVSSGVAGETVAVRGASTGAGDPVDDPNTVRRLKLAAMAALPGDVSVPAGGLLSGLLSPFPVFGAGHPTLDVQIGDEGPLPVLLPAVPQDLAGARALLEQALHQASDSPAFQLARVLDFDGRLILLPGTPESVTLTAAAGDATTLGDLGFTGAGVLQVGVVLSGELAPTVTLSAASPSLVAVMAPDTTAVILDLSALPSNDLEAVRQRLEDELRTNGTGAAFTAARVLLVDGQRLLVIPGDDGFSAQLSNGPGDDLSLSELAFALGQAVGVGEALGPATCLRRSTVFGRLAVVELTLASESLFTEPLEVEHRQVGCVRYSYLPAESRAPRRFRSQPDMALLAATAAALEKRARQLGLPTVERLDATEREAVIRRERARVLARLTPRFTSTRFGDPGYAQLRLDAAPELATGAEDGSALGAFSRLAEPRRQTQLHQLLDEYLRFGLDAGFFEVT